MFTRLSNSLFFRITVSYVILAHLLQLVWPTQAFALTSGPSTPEVQSFEPVGTSELVSLPSGDFNYNIPLLDVEGYPINISYHSGSGLEDEASSVGLGWNLNIGVLNRQMRGIPDDFDGDKVKYEYNIRDNVTVGVTPEPGWEVFGGPLAGFGISAGVTHNNYRGLGFEFGVSTPSMKIANVGGTPLTGGLNMNFSSQNGTTLSPSVGMKEEGQITDGKVVTGTWEKVNNGSLTFSARSGLKSLSFSNSEEEKDLKGNVTASGKTGASISFGSPVFVPTINMAYGTYAFAGKLTAGAAAVGVHPNFKLSGSVSVQSLKNREQSVPSFGMLHLGDASNRDQRKGNFDFTREKDGPIIPYKKTNSGKTIGTPNLPMATYSYDLFNASSQAVSGMFRAHRSEVGMLGDRYLANTSLSGSAGFEFGTGAGLHFGGNASLIGTTSGTRKWNNFLNKYSNNGKYSSSKALDKPDAEPYYFKLVGEPTFDSHELRNQFGGDDPVQFQLNLNQVQNTLVVQNGDKQSIPLSTFKRTQRAKRNTYMSVLRANEASEVGLEKHIYSYDLNTSYNAQGELPRTSLQRVSNGGGRAAHHISEISVTEAGGSRHIFGIPAYNTYQKELTFNISKDNLAPDLDMTNNYVKYSGTDNTTGNTNGVDHYFQQTEIPPYAYAYLLTGIISPDYVDVTNDGITDDDLGTAYKFNYTKINNKMNWRTPLSSTVKTANYIQGFEAKTGKNGDDKAAYVYGEKELWYPHSIESKHFIAEFKYSDCESGVGVVDEHGVLGTNAANYARPQKLDEIRLFSKADRKKGIADPTYQATPIKTIVFKYNYELCENTPNSNADSGGKLTLKEVYFTYGKSYRTRLSSYKFAYGDYSDDSGGAPDGVPDEVYNPDYQAKAQDIWGVYKPNDDPNLPNWLFPFTDQSAADPQYAQHIGKTNADAYAAAWQMNRIKTPSGGIIEVDYESKDYAYVQNLRAMDMFKVEGFGKTKITTPEPWLYKFNEDEEYSNNFMFVRLPANVADDETFRKGYLKSLKEVFVNIRTSVDNRNLNIYPNTPFEQISGFVNVEDGGMVNPNGDVAWLRLAPIGLNGKEGGTPEINPIAYNAWNFVYTNLNEMVFPGSNPDQTGVGALMAAAAAFADIGMITSGFGQFMRAKEIATEVVPAKSWVRLFAASGSVKGGGARVASIRMSDNWNSMTTEGSQEYGQVYDYTTKDENGNTISSGVAANLPGLGRDANPMIFPKRYEQRNVLARNTPHETTGPVGESLMPSPSIVHSQVKVTSIKPASIKRHGDGHVVQEYYTAKDFPVIFDQTEIDNHHIPEVEVNLVGEFSENHYTGSQGYVIILNDMHGKPKMSKVFGEGQESPISFVKYTYKEREKRHSDNVATKKASYHTLNNDDVTFVLPDGTTTQGEWGVDQDITVDARYHDALTTGLSVDLNAEMIVPFLPPLPSVWPSPTLHRSSVKTIVVSKVIRKHGLLNRVEAHEDGATVATENIAWDGETGQVLLTRTTNEYEDPTYSFSYPAYWAYDKMGPAYKNTAATWTYADLQSVCNPSSSNTLLVKGDELLLETLGSNMSKAWVLDPTVNAVIDEQGAPLHVSKIYKSIKVVRSGRRNLQSASMGNVVAKQNPLDIDVQNVGANKKILTASAIEYHDVRQTLCGVPEVSSTCTCALSLKGAAFFTVLNDLMGLPLEDNKKPWLNRSINLENIPSYTSSALPGALDVDDGCDVYFHPTVSLDDYGCAKSVTMELRQHCLGYEESLCSISLDIDPTSPYCLEYFEDVSNLAYVNIGACESSDKFTLEGRVTYSCLEQQTDEMVSLSGTSGCFPILECDYENQYSCVEIGGVVNPFHKGIRGNWSPKTTYTYLTGRTGAQGTNATDIRSDGTYENYGSYWQYQNGSWQQNPANWTWTATVSKSLALGQELENKDPLGRYSAAIFGYKHQLPIAVGANSRYTQLAYANFEVEEDLDQACGTHFYFRDNALDLRYGKAHSGNGYARIQHQGSLKSVQPITTKPCVDLPDAVPYRLDECDCAGIFSPEKGTYLLTYWRSSDFRDDMNIAFIPQLMDGMDAVVKLDGQAIQPDDVQESKIIEGWQRVAVTFSIPLSASRDIEVSFENNAAGTSGNSSPLMYLDDVRIHPKDGAMKSYVYDHTTLRLLAEGDDNNYYTFYQYGPDGSLMGVKRETEKGIMTLQANQANPSTVNK
ncbi:MAG: hypothetical protein AB8F95_17370 [Bacteroidia bacterium]